MQVSVAHVTTASLTMPVYVGRAMPAFKATSIDRDLFAAIQAGSPLGNPFPPNQSLANAIDQYSKYLQRQLRYVNSASTEFARLIGLLAEHKHITLCCWCAKHPRPPIEQCAKSITPTWEAALKQCNILIWL